MNRILWITLVSVILVVSIGFFAPIQFATSKSRPLYGNFDIGIRCMGGHETFLYLDEAHAYYHCPGHRDMKAMGRIVRSKDSLVIFRLRDNTAWLRVDHDGNRHRVTSMDKGWSEEFKQVSNPWRTWLPRLLPKH
jgi:hypothetical protein